MKRKRTRRDNGKKRRIERDESNGKERKIEKQKDRDRYDPHWFEWDLITLEELFARNRTENAIFSSVKITLKS